LGKEWLHTCNGKGIQGLCLCTLLMPSNESVDKISEIELAELKINCCFTPNTEI